MKKAAVIVPVATVWTAPESAREMDEPILKEEGTIRGWVETMDYEQKLDLCTNNRVQTQVLFGEEVFVTEEKNGWSRVLIPSQSSSKDEQGYPGWIPSVQIGETIVEAGGKKAVVIREKAMLSVGGRQMPLYYGTLLSVVQMDEEKVWVNTPIGTGFMVASAIKVLEPDYRAAGKDFIASGEQFLGLPYLWGGMSNMGYDCSGFVYTMCRVHGITIPRDADDQSFYGSEVSLDSLEPGDALFFAYEEGKGSIHHIGFYYGNGKLLHSPKTGKCVEITDIKGFEYEKELCAARRYSSEG